MDVWLLWLILAVLLGVAEMLTLTAALGLLGGAALLAAVSAAIGFAVPVQLIVFAAGSAAGLSLVRPIARRHMHQPSLQRFGVDALVGKPAYVLQEVTGHGGRIRIDGEEWTARSYHDALSIPAGATVHVMEIRGAVALVYPQE